MSIDKISPDTWNNIPYPIVEWVKLFVRYFRKTEADIITLQEKQEEFKTKTNFHITRIGTEINKLEMNLETKMDLNSKNFTNSYNELR